MKLAYFVHDLHDAAVARRCTQFALGAAEVQLAGFSRGRDAPSTVAGLDPIALGRTEDARLAARAGLVFRHLAWPRAAAQAAQDADVLVARNLEMLAIAARVRRPGQRLVYECLDIHRLLLGDGRAARLLQGVEKRLLGGVDLVIVSSPSFAEEYFRKRQGHAGPILLVENKVMGKARTAIDPPADGPRVIGWFGMIRCARSFQILSDITRASAGRIEVLIAGRPTPSEFDDFEGSVATAPGMRFIGPYRPEDLPTLYGQVHYAWAIDYFEEGLNSAWLLPNRLYESIAHGAVPIALADVATGAWLGRQRVGVVVTDPASDIPHHIASADLAAERATVAAVPDEAVLITPADITGMMDTIGGRRS